MSEVAGAHQNNQKQHQNNSLVIFGVRAFLPNENCMETSMPIIV